MEIILFGDEKQYTLNHERIEFRHCSEKIEMEDEPVRAIKRKKDSSMVRMAEAVKNGEEQPMPRKGKLYRLKRDEPLNTNP